MVLAIPVSFLVYIKQPTKVQTQMTSKQFNKIEDADQTSVEYAAMYPTKGTLLPRRLVIR